MSLPATLTKMARNQPDLRTINVNEAHHDDAEETIAEDGETK